MPTQPKVCTRTRLLARPRRAKVGPLSLFVASVFRLYFSNDFRHENLPCRHFEGIKIICVWEASLSLSPGQLLLHIFSANQKCVRSFYVSWYHSVKRSLKEERKRRKYHMKKKTEEGVLSGHRRKEQKRGGNCLKRWRTRKEEKYSEIGVCVHAWIFRVVGCQPAGWGEGFLAASLKAEFEWIKKSKLNPTAKKR